MNLLNFRIYENCNHETQDFVRSQFLSSKDSIVILGGVYKTYLNLTEENKFINKNNISITSGFINSIQELLDNNLKVILIYPIPMIEWHVPQRLMNLIPKNSFNASKYLTNNPQTTSLEMYLEKNKEIFDLLNSLTHKNLLKIFPHTLFCDTKISNRCLTHDSKNVYYFDDRHLSSQGSEILVEEIYFYIKKLI